MPRFKRRLLPFIPIRRDLLKDPVWKGLPNSAKVLYFYLRAQFDSRDENKDVGLSFREAEECVGSSKTVNRAYKELCEKGFIQKEKRGGLYGGVTTYKFVGQFKDFSHITRT